MANGRKFSFLSIEFIPHLRIKNNSRRCDEVPSSSLLPTPRAPAHPVRRYVDLSYYYSILNSLDENTFQINPTISGTYGVTAFYEYNGDLCISNTAYENFAIIQTSLQDADDINFSYYQIDNNFLVIDFESDKENNINVDMFDSFGKVVYNNKATPVNQYIPINELVNGVYYIRLIINNKFVSTKSIIIN